MIKKLLSIASMAFLTISASAETVVTTLWESATPVTIEWGTASCEISAAKCEEFKAGDILGVTITEKTDADAWPQFTICGSTESYEWTELKNIGVWDETTFPVVINCEITDEFVELAKIHGIFIKGTAVKISKITLTTETGPAVPMTEKQLTLDGANLLLSQFVELPDDAEIVVTLSISNKDSSVASGWGVGSIHPISDYDTSLYSFTAKEVSEEGAPNNYKFTAGQFKDWAKDGDDYRTDTWGQQGLTFNVYNGATITGITSYVKNEGEDEGDDEGENGGSTAITDIEAANENAPVEYYNLQGVRVENPSNGLYIRRQGSKITKVII